MRKTIILTILMMIATASGTFGQNNGFVATPVPNPGDSAVQVSDQKSGSILVFPFYGSDGTATNDTRLTITNVGPAGLPATVPGVFPSLGTPTDVLNNLNVHLFWIDSSCDQADGYVCFTKFQTWSFKASEWDPVTARGLLIAVAVDPMGFPISYNGLIGNAFVNCNVTQGNPAVTEKWIGNYGAESFASLGVLLAAPVAGVQSYWYTTGANPNAPLNTATLAFNNSPRSGGLVAAVAGTPGYDAAPNSFAAQFQSPADSVGQTILTVSLGGSIGYTINPITGLPQTLVGNAYGNNGVGSIYRDDEKAYSFTGPLGSCQQLLRITTTFPRIAGGLGNGQFPTGKTGVVIWQTVGPAVGLFITPPQQIGGIPSITTLFGIRTLHKRNVDPTGELTMPLLMPVCVI